MKHNVIGDLTLEDITAFLANGKLENAPAGVPEYLNILEKVRGMLLRFDLYPNDDIIINHLVLQDELTRAKARSIIAETREYFYVDSLVSKQAWDNIYASKLDMLINAAILSAKDTKDYMAIVPAVREARNIRKGDKEENEIPYELINQKRFTIYTFNVEDLGLPKANRNNVKALIQNKFLGLSDKEKNQIYREADILPFKTFPNEQEDAR